VATVLGVLAVAALGGWLWQRRQAAAEITRQRLAYLAKVDSLLYTVGAMQIDVTAMRAAPTPRAGASRLHDLLAEAGSDPAARARSGCGSTPRSSGSRSSPRHPRRRAIAAGRSLRWWSSSRSRAMADLQRDRFRVRTTAGDGWS
jgi:hypothetical protein